MKFIKLFSSDADMNTAISEITHGDGAFLYYYNYSVKLIDQRHPGGANCIKLPSVNMSPVKLDASSTKKTPAVADVLYSTADGKLTLDALTNNVDNTPIAICVIPEVIENFSEGDDSTGAVKTARFVSLNYMNYKTPTTGNENVQDMYFGNIAVGGNKKGGTDKTAYIGGKWNTLYCVYRAKKQLYICDGVTNNGNEGYCAPACCCVTYYTPGTKPGDWYLPSIGELYQIYTNKAAINEKRTAIKGSGFRDGYKSHYWSSRSCDNLSEYYVDFHDGSIYRDDRDYEWNSRVLGFLALEY